jgi:hypothetical protein
VGGVRRCLFPHAVTPVWRWISATKSQRYMRDSGSDGAANTIQVLDVGDSRLVASLPRSLTFRFIYGTDLVYSNRADADGTERITVRRLSLSGAAPDR